MRILLLIHPDFFDSEPQRPLGEIRAWLDRYAASLSERGHQVRKFHSAETRVRDFDWVHCFSAVEAETWVALRQAGCKVAITPSLGQLPGKAFRRQASILGMLLERGLIRVARAAFQRRWPPVDEASFASAVDRFLVPSESWTDALRRAWRLNGANIVILPASPEQAALRFEQVIQSE